MLIEHFIDCLHFEMTICRDLMSWIKSMMALVSSDELAKDVTGAEALLERHKVCWHCRPVLWFL